MSAVKSVLALLLIGAMLPQTGCAVPLSQWCKDKGSENQRKGATGICVADSARFPHLCRNSCIRHDDSMVPTVQVGGQVHKPGEVEIGISGLTLRRALMSAGGFRELAQVQETTSNPSIVAKLQELVSVANEIGKIDAEQRVYLQLPTEAHKFIPQSNDDLAADFEKVEDGEKTLLDELSISFNLKTLELLRDFSRDVGRSKELLRLNDDPDFQEEVKTLAGWQEESLKNAFNESVENQAKVMEELLNLRGKTSLATLQTDLFVSIERAAAEPAVTYYIPYELAVTGIASEISLRDGDVVNVIEVRASELMPSDLRQGGPRNVVIQGYVEKPGIARGVATLGNIHAFTKPTITDPDGVWMVVRASQTGRSQQVFVLPDRMIEPNGALSNAPTLEGDLYVYSKLAQVPIVFESLLAHTMDVNNQRCLDRLRANRERCQKQCHRRLDCIRDELSNACNQVPTPPVGSMGIF